MWNANMIDASATQFVQGENALTYTIPLLGGILADGLFGEDWNIVLGVFFCYIPGFILTWLTTFPSLVSLL